MYDSVFDGTLLLSDAAVSDKVFVHDVASSVKGAFHARPVVF